LTTIYYVDTSAWLKRYVEEEGSDAVAKLFASGEHISPSFAIRPQERLILAEFGG